MHSCQNWAQNLFALIVHIIVSIIFSLQLSPPILDAKVVAEWLTSKQHSTSDTRQLILVNRWDLKHLVSKPDSYISFAVGQSGWIGVMCFENGLKQGKPSWMHPSKDKPSPDEPTSGQYSGCPVFVTVDGKEYMAIYDKHKIIHTWYLENNTQRVVFDFKSKSATPTKPKNLCVIDDNTCCPWRRLPCYRRHNQSIYVRDRCEEMDPSEHFNSDHQCASDPRYVLCKNSRWHPMPSTVLSTRRVFTGYGTNRWPSEVANGQTAERPGFLTTEYLCWQEQHIVCDRS